MFLLQVHGVREWRIGRVAQPRLQADAPLKILTNFRAERSWRLEPGDMLYLPPKWAHDGVAQGECMTCSIGYRAPARHHVAAGLLERLLDAQSDIESDVLYRDPRQRATAFPARLPAELQAFATKAVARELARARRLALVLGELLSEPKRDVVFDRGEALDRQRGARLDRRTRMLYDGTHVFINGEAYRASGRDATLLRRLADRRVLAATDLARLSAPARTLMEAWLQAGWLRGENLT